MARENVIKCPCCYSGDYYKQYKVHVEEAANELSSSDENQIIDRITEIIRNLWGQDYANWNICRNCGNGFANPFIAFNSEYYTITYSSDIFYTPWKWEYEKVYHFIKRFYNKSLHLLEIGAGNGTFVTKISEELIDKNNILTTEYSDFGINEIVAKGISCIPKNIFELNTEENRNRFDIICMFQVFEHMDRLDDVFETINRISKRGSDLFIAVPSHKHREFYFSLGKSLDFPPGHISCFSPTGMSIISERHGWGLIGNFYQPTRKRFQTYQLLTEWLSRHEKLEKKLHELGPKLIRKTMINITLTLVGLGKIRDLLRLNLGRYGVSHLFWLKKIER
jgi:SAM-dependent methyltransferase